MSEPVVSPNAQWQKRIRDLEKAVAALQAGNGLDGATIRDGATHVRTAAGDPALELGKTDDDTYALRAYDDGVAAVEVGELPGGHHGVTIQGGGGTFPAFHVDERGLDTPQFMVPTGFYGNGVAPFLTIGPGAGWVLIGRIVLPPIVSQAALRMLMGYQFDAGTAGELNITSNSWLAAGWIAETTSPTLSGGGGSTEVCDWLHQIPLGSPLAGVDFYFVDVFGRVTSGAGNLLAYQPWFSFMNEDHGATAPGLWRPVA